MNSSLTFDSAVAEDEMDLVAEMRLRTWARHNYVPAAERETAWPICVLDEMQQIDRENEQL